MPEGAARRFRAMRNHVAAPMIIAAKEHPTANPAMAPLSKPDDLLLLELAVGLLLLVEVTGAAVTVIISFDVFAVVLERIDELDKPVDERSEEEALRIWAMCIPSPSSQHVAFFGPQQ